MATTPGGGARRRNALAALAGVLTPLAFAPYGWWPLAIVGPAILLILVATQTSRAAAWAGWCFGLGLFGHGVWWIQVSVHQFGVPYYSFSVSVTALFIAAMALYPALFAALVVRLAGGTPRRVWLLAAPLWTLLELLRGWFATGFPWLSLGYSQVDGPLAAYAPLVGVSGISCLLAVLAAVWAQAWCTRGPATLAAAVAVSALVFGGARAFGTFEPTTPHGAPRRAVLVQGAVPQTLKWEPEARARALERYLELSAGGWDADVLLWPETAITAFPEEVPELLATLTQRATDTGTSLLVGMPTGEPWAGRYYNSVVALGTSPGRYDKRHLVPFGEFFPFKAQLAGLASLLDIPLSDFSAGAADVLHLDVAGDPAGISICYEDAFGREVRAGLPAARLLVNVSNDAWFGDTIAPHQHLEIARMRALETGRDLLRATNTGVTAVIDHRGRIVAAAPQFVPTALRASYQPRSGATPYVRLGDGPLIVLLAVLVLVFSVRRRAPRDAG